MFYHFVLFSHHFLLSLISIFSIIFLKPKSIRFQKNSSDQRSSLICNTNARHEWHECNKKQHERHACHRATRVLHERHECNRSATLTTRVRYEWKCWFFFLSGFSFSNIHESRDCKGKWEGISLTPHCNFHPLHRNLEISRVITANSSLLHTDCTRTRTANVCFPSASH